MILNEEERAALVAIVDYCRRRELSPDAWNIRHHVRLLQAALKKEESRG